MQLRKAMPVFVGIVLLAGSGSVLAATTGVDPGTFDPSLIAYGDGSIADWGASGTPNQYDMGNDFWVPGNAGVSFWLEDRISCRNGRFGYVGPGWGGQNFDVEAAYLGAHDDALSLAFVTGFDAAGQRTSKYGGWNRPGDAFFDFDDDGTWDVGVVVADRSGVAAGSVYIPAEKYRGGSTWYTRPTDFPASAPFRVRTGRAVLLPAATLLGLGYSDAVNEAYNYASSRWWKYDPLDHNIVELGLDLSQLATAWPILADPASMRAHWTMGCGNDLFNLSTERTSSPHQPPETIPEPATLTLMLLGLPLVEALRRRKRRS